MVLRSLRSDVSAAMSPTTIPGGPEVRLLDARRAGLDEAGLLAWARAQTTAARAAFVTRSYRYPYAALAWHSDPVGIDLERVERCDAAFAESICTPAEWAEAGQTADSDGYVTALWSSKEALAKALGDAIRYDPRRLESPMLWPRLRSGPWRCAPITVPADHTGWMCWRQAQDTPDPPYGIGTSTPGRRPTTDTVRA